VNSTDTAFDWPDLNTVNGATETDEIRLQRATNTESSLMQFAYLIEHEDMVPKNYEEAMLSPNAEHWKAAIHAEIRSLIKLKTWTVVPKPLVHQDPILRIYL
jgi:hypothetical protein